MVRKSWHHKLQLAKPITIPCTLMANSKAELVTFTFFPSLQQFCLLSGLQTAAARSKVNTYQWVRVIVIVLSYGHIDQGVHYMYKEILDLLNEESVSGARSSRASL